MHVSKRCVVALVVATGCGDLASSSSTSALSTPMRVVAANLTSGNGQSYDGGHGGRILDALDPDVVLIQEFRVGNNSDGDLQDFVDQNVGVGFHYFRESASLPNGIISRWPILDSGAWNDPRVSNREFAWARIDVPGPQDLWAVSIHLLTSGSSERSAEATALTNWLDAEVPSSDLLVVGGDLNTRNASERALTTLGRRVSSALRPSDQNGNSDTNASRNRPYDWVLPSPDLEAYHVDVSFGGRSFSEGLVLDTRLFSADPSAIAPAQVRDSGASGMQHHAVVRDFLIP